MFLNFFFSLFAVLKPDGLFLFGVPKRNPTEAQRSGFRLEMRSKETEMTFPACGEGNEADFDSTTHRQHFHRYLW